MSYAEESLKELMEEVRRSKRSVLEDVASGPVGEEMDLEIFTAPVEPVDVDACIRDTLEALKPLRLSPRAQQMMSEFITFHLRTQELRSEIPEASAAGCNLLIRTDDPAQARLVFKVVAKRLDIRGFYCYPKSEEALLQEYSLGASQKSRSRSTEVTPLIPKSKKLIYISGCREVSSRSVALRSV